MIDNEIPGNQKPNIHTLCVVTHRPRWARHSKVKIGKLLGGRLTAAKAVFVSQPFPECHRASIHPLKGAPIMDATVKMVLVIALVAAVVLLLFFGGGMTTGTMSGGMMGR